MSTLNVTTIIPDAGTDTDLDLSGKGTGRPDLQAGFKVGGTAGVPVADLRTSSGTASSSTFLRGDGTWNTAGPSQATQAALEAETNEDTYAAPDLIKYSPGVAKVWVHFDAEDQTLVVDDSLNVTSVTDSSTGKYVIVIANDMANATYSLTTAAMMGQTSGGGNDDGRVVGFDRSVAPTAAACALSVLDINNAADFADADEVCSTIHGDLA